MFSGRCWGGAYFGRRFWGGGSSVAPAPGRYWAPSAFGRSYWGARYFPGGVAAAPTPPAPLSAETALIEFFRATPALVDAVPGGLWPFLRPGETPTPYATITHVAGRNEFATGDKGIVVADDTFRVTLCGGKNEALEEIELLFYATFNHNVLAAAPLRLRNGRVVSVRVASAARLPGAEMDKNNRRVYRRALTLRTTTVRTLS